MYGPCFVMKYLVSFLVLQSPRLRRESWLLYFYCLLIHVIISIQCLFPTVPWVGLRRVIVAFLYHTHVLLFSNFVESLCIQKQTLAGFSS